MKRDAKAEARAINTILWRDWNPIGCGVPEDEYESYVWPVYKLLIDAGSREDITACLCRVAEVNMTVPAPKTRTDAVVDKLLALKLANIEEKYK